MCILLNVKKHEKTFALNVDIFKSQNIDHFLFTYNLIYNIIYIKLDLLVDVNNSIRILYKDIGLIKLGKN